MEIFIAKVTLTDYTLPEEEGEECVKREENNLGWCLKNPNKNLLIGAKEADILGFDNTVEKVELKIK